MPTPSAPVAYRLEELAEATGVSVRTIRFYLQRGLLPAPEFRGPATVYGEDHRRRLAAIRVLQERDLPLEAIARELDRATPEELEAIARGEVRVQPGRAVVLDTGRAATPSAAPADPFLAELEEPLYERSAPRARSFASAVRLPGPPESRRTVWTLAPGLELHLTEPASPALRGLVRRLLNLAGSFVPKPPKGDSA